VGMMSRVGRSLLESNNVCVCVCVCVCVWVPKAKDDFADLMASCLCGSRGAILSSSAVNNL
jgi:hypothetical protein